MVAGDRGVGVTIRYRWQDELHRLRSFLKLTGDDDHAIEVKAKQLRSASEEEKFWLVLHYLKERGVPLRLRLSLRLGWMFSISGSLKELNQEFATRGLVIETELPRNRRLSHPTSAEFLFYLFMTPQDCDALVGDLEERYKLVHKNFGRRRANFWYWTQMVISLGPIVLAWAKRLSLKPVMGVVGWAVAKGLIGHDGWLAAAVELWKRVRS